MEVLPPRMPASKLMSTKSARGKTATNVGTKWLYRDARVCGFPQMTKPTADSKVMLQGQVPQSWSDSRVMVCMGSAADGCQGELRDVIAKLTHTHQQKPLAVRKAGRQQAKVWEAEQAGHIYLSEGPQAVGCVDGMKRFYLGTENTKNCFINYSVLEEERTDLKDRWCLWNM